MTRWARGGEANRKKPFEASDWSELKTKKAKDTKSSSQNDSEPKRKKAKDKSVPDSHTEKSDCRRLPAEEDVNVVDELEKLGKETALTTNAAEKIVLEEFVRKDRRREDRRLKRQQNKLNNRVCFNCRQRGHDLANCPEVVGDVDHGTGVCFKCGSTEHKVQQCKVKVAHGQFPFAKCFICGEVGHLSRSCPDNPRGLYPNGGCCNNCGSVEHYKKDCPELQQKKGLLEMTLPTLSSQTKVDEEPTLQRPRHSGPPTKKTKVVKF